MPESLVNGWRSTTKAAAELWVRIFKAGSGRPSVTWTDCVVEAIRFGWVDGQKLPLDETSYLQRLTPRKPNSNWSVKNREHAIRLIAEGRMAPAGLAHVEAAKADGRWESAYAGSATMMMPQDFLDALEGMPAAKAFFQTLDRKTAARTLAAPLRAYAPALGVVRMSAARAECPIAGLGAATAWPASAHSAAGRTSGLLSQLQITGGVGW
jgi:uncharacterized protein YdeI (YjbR/CyaY-like superfamily)